RPGRFPGAGLDPAPGHARGRSGQRPPARRDLPPARGGHRRPGPLDARRRAGRRGGCVMARVIVSGAGLGGLSTAALLAMDGHDATVLERDPQPLLEEAERCWTGWERRGVNQFRLPHYLLPRWRQLLEHELPDVATALVDRGALRFEQIRSMPTELTGGVRPDDDQFTALTARRPVLEAGFASTAERIFGVHLRRGVGVAGLLTGDPSLPGVPHVTGVRAEDGEERHADRVVDGGGGRSAVPPSLTAAGARTPHAR